MKFYGNAPSVIYWSDEYKQGTGITFRTHYSSAYVSPTAPSSSLPIHWIGHITTSGLGANVDSLTTPAFSPIEGRFWYQVSKYSSSVMIASTSAYYSWQDNSI
jgi:hypothetical protein